MTFYVNNKQCGSVLCQGYNSNEDKLYSNQGMSLFFNLLLSKGGVYSLQKDFPLRNGIAYSCA